SCATPTSRTAATRSTTATRPARTPTTITICRRKAAPRRPRRRPAGVPQLPRPVPPPHLPPAPALRPQLPRILRPNEDGEPLGSPSAIDHGLISSTYWQQLVHFTDLGQGHGLFRHMGEGELALLAPRPAGPLHQQGKPGAVGAVHPGEIHLDLLVLGEELVALGQGMGRAVEAQVAGQPEVPVPQVFDADRLRCAALHHHLVAGAGTAFGALLVLRRLMSSSRPLFWISGENWSW